MVRLSMFFYSLPATPYQAFAGGRRGLPDLARRDGRSIAEQGNPAFRQPGQPIY